MKTRHFFRIVILMVMVLALNSCILEEGNPDLTGSWTCVETSEIFMKSTKGTSTFPVSIQRDASNLDKYYIENFYRLGNGIQVIVLVEGYSVSVPKQTVDGFVFEGSGTLAADYNLIELNYTADDFGDEIDHVQATFSR